MKNKYVLILMLVLPGIIMAANPNLLNRNNASKALKGSRGWRLNQSTESYYGEDGALIPEMRFHYFYNSDTSALVDSMYIDEWDEYENVWMAGFLKGYATHSPQGRITELLTYAYDSDSDEYYAYLKFALVYDEQNRIKLVSGNLSGSLLGSDQEWVSLFRNHFVYGAGTSFSTYSYNMFEDPSSIYGKSEFIFDDRGRIIVETGYTSPDSLAWNLEVKTNYEYHPQDNHTGADIIEYMSANMALMMMFDNVVFPGLWESYTEEEWVENSWVLRELYTYEYDDLMKLQSIYSHYRSGANWNIYGREQYFYGENGQLSHRIQQDYLSEDYYSNEERTDYVWESYTSSNGDIVNPAPSFQLSVYPSPFANQIHVSSQNEEKAPIKVRIYNLKGQLVRSLSNFSGSEIIWDGKDGLGRNCPSGVYLIRAHQSGKVANSKALKLK